MMYIPYTSIIRRQEFSGGHLEKMLHLNIIISDFADDERLLSFWFRIKEKPKLQRMPFKDEVDLKFAHIDCCIQTMVPNVLFLFVSLLLIYFPYNAASSIMVGANRVVTGKVPQTTIRPLLLDLPTNDGASVLESIKSAR